MSITALDIASLLNSIGSGESLQDKVQDFINERRFQESLDRAFPDVSSRDDVIGTIRTDRKSDMDKKEPSAK